MHHKLGQISNNRVVLICCHIKNIKQNDFNGFARLIREIVKLKYELYPLMESANLRMCHDDLSFLPGNAEEVDVAVVDREVKEDSSGASVQPQAVFEIP